MKMILGTDFIFSTDRLLFNQRNRSTKQKISEQSRVGQRPVLQSLGAGSDELTFSGAIHPCVRGNPKSLNELRDLMLQGEEHTLIDDQGEIHGKWMVDSVTEGATLFDKNALPRKIQFTIKLRRSA